MSTYRLLLVGTALATYLLIVVGAIVRATGSGLGCPDWPTCHGQLIPPPDLSAIIEYSHRTVAALVSVLIVATTLATWALRRPRRRLLVPASLVPFLLVAQILLGAVTVLMELPPAIVLVHLAVALSILGLLVWMSVSEGEGRVPDLPGVRRLRRMAWGALFAVFALIMTGAYMRSLGAGFACAGWPDCNGQLAPFGQSPVIDVHLLHRFVAYAASAHVLFTLRRAWRTRHLVPGLSWAVPALGLALVFQLVIGIGAVSSQVPVVLRILHVAGASAVWAATVALAALVSRPLVTATDADRQAAADPEPVPAGQPEHRTAGSMARAYLQLTKPGIISLLLVTTLAAMMMAARGMPDLGLVFVTLLGGAMSAGAANTFNCYIDRDIDRLMGRTSRRPIPAGVISPNRALAFGVVLGIAAILVLGLGANWLAAALSLCGFLYYVLVYTCWLKRSTPNNIVLGGAAGAVPPLVGWAAVTGEVSVLAVYLFAVIFLWTPPHFWALALMIRKEYEKAQVPMLPTHGREAETRRQIAVYSLILVGFTLLVVTLREVGVFYFVAAASLGGVFLYHTIRLLREATQKAARNLFRYSILYLALLFLALVIDRWSVA